MTLCIIFEKRRWARSYLKQLIKDGYTNRGEIFKIDSVAGSPYEITERQGYAAIFRTEKKLEEIKGMFDRIFPQSCFNYYIIEK